MYIEEDRTYLATTDDDIDDIYGDTGSRLQTNYG